MPSLRSLPLLLALLPLLAVPARGQVVRAEAAGAARLDASVRVEPAELPAKKRGLRELTFAFGKRSASAELARLAEEALIDRAYIQRRAGDGAADIRLQLTLDRARSSWENFENLESRPSSYEVGADVGYRWLDADGRILFEGEVDGFGRARTEAAPRKPDAARAWARLLDDVVARAFAAAFEAAAFGNDPPPKGGWIPSSR